MATSHRSFCGFIGFMAIVSLTIPFDVHAGTATPSGYNDGSGYYYSDILALSFDVVQENVAIKPDKARLPSISMFAKSENTAPQVNTSAVMSWKRGDVSQAYSKRYRRQI